jgi:hypothetical protein
MKILRAPPLTLQTITQGNTKQINIRKEKKKKENKRNRY